LSQDELNAAFEASIESMKQDAYKKLLEVHEASKASLRDVIDVHKFQVTKMPSCSLAEFREGLASRIGRHSQITFPAVCCCICILQIVF
jgi:hypothetical protein